MVDDDRSSAVALAELLGTEGHESRAVVDAAAALAALDEARWDVVITDLAMPVVSGLELIREIVRRGDGPDIVVVTATADVRTAIAAMRAGALDTLTKPCDPEELRLVLDRVLEHRRLRFENQEYRRRLEEKVGERTLALQTKVAEVEGLYGELKETYEATLHALVRALESRDLPTKGHSVRVVAIAERLAREAGVEGEALERLRWGAILHDVGKIGLPDAILLKQGPLTADERLVMERHPEIGYAMLRHLPFLGSALDVVLSHQERWDGGGYPRGLSGEAIPRAARIFAVADAFDAILSHRPYRAARSLATARAAIEQGAGSQFDPAVVEAFRRIPEAEWVRLAQDHEDTDSTITGLKLVTGPATGGAPIPGGSAS